MLYTTPEKTAKTILNNLKNLNKSECIYFRRLAEKMISQDPYIPNNTFNELTSLYNKISRLCRYTNEPIDIETLKTPLGIMRDLYNYGYLIGDCDDMTQFCCLILYFLGYNVKCKIVKQNGEDVYSHIYPLVEISDMLIPFDLCCPYGAGSEINNITEYKIIG